MKLSIAIATLAATTAISTTTRADEHQQRAPMLAAYVQECGSCHVAFPPDLLPAASWKRVMTNLTRHFGTDASLDATTTSALSTWIEASSSRARRVREEPPQDRITRSAWFVREHDEISAATWKLPAVKSAANCAACHTQANQGDFSERRIRIPR